MNFEKRNNIYKIIMTVVVTATITFILTTVLLNNFYFKKRNGLIKALSTDETQSIDEKIEKIKAYLEQYYLGELDEDKMNEYAIKGYVAGLGDEYTQYLTKDEYEELMVDVNGNYVGIGIYMTQDKYGNTVVLLPIKGSPAEETDIKTGDIIKKVNGEDVTGLELDVIANRVKGEEGTTVDLEIQRDEETITKTVTRKRVVINNIETEVLNNKIGYIQLMSFDGGCARRIRREIRRIIE